MNPANKKTPYRVLIADDVLETRRNTRLMLADNPMVDIVAIAHDGQEAMRGDGGHALAELVVLLELARLAAELRFGRRAHATWGQGLLRGSHHRLLIQWARNRDLSSADNVEHHPRCRRLSLPLPTDRDDSRA